MISQTFLFIYFIIIVSVNGEDECGDCQIDKCKPPVDDCLAGIVKDYCNCCYMCGQKDGERCYNTTIQSLPLKHKKYGSCGEGLECRLRTDMESNDPPEAICYCVKTEAICGSDGNTYESECKLTEERYRKRNGLIAASRGPCKTVPKIISPPENMYNKTGSYVTFSCEVMGWPVPTIEWYFRSTTNEMTGIAPLPSDDSHIAVQSRGGPSNYEVTGWLQLLDITEADMGTYSCVARNSEGEMKANAKLIVTDAKETKKRYEYDNENEIH